MTATEMITEPGADAQTVRRKRVIVSMGGKGGVGKTNVMTGLAEWYQDQQIPVTLFSTPRTRRGAA
jgi:signal recognition particle GTPase